MRAKRQIFHLSSESPRDSSRQTQPGEPIVTMRALQSAEHAATYVALNITRTLDEVLVQSVGLHSFCKDIYYSMSICRTFSFLLAVPLVMLLVGSGACHQTRNIS